MAITAKVKLTHKDEHGDGEYRLAQLHFSPDYGAGRNKDWALATPHLELKMTVRGDVADRFKLYEPVTLTFESGESAPAPIMNFGEALKALRSGQRVTREGWNGKGMWLVLVPGSTITVSAGRPLGDAAPELVGEHVEYRPHIDMKTVDGEIVPWVASQTDLLAEDWRVS